MPINQLPQQAQPPIVMDVQRLIEHMKADFRTELQAFKAELLAAVGAQLQALMTSTPAPINTTVNASGMDPEIVYQTIKRVMGEFERPGATSAPRTDRVEAPPPLFVPSDLLAPREGTVAVHTSDEGAGDLGDATAALKKLKGNKK